jgi:protein subunit release factor A
LETSEKTVIPYDPFKFERVNVMKLLFSLTRKDFEMQTFTVGGHGGSGKDTSNSGVRIIHPASGAVGEGREFRSNAMNRKAAFERLAKSKKFRDWHRVECAKRLGQVQPETPEEIRARVNKMVDDGLQDGSIQIEYLAEGGV